MNTISRRSSHRGYSAFAAGALILILISWGALVTSLTHEISNLASPESSRPRFASQESELLPGSSTGEDTWVHLEASEHGALVLDW